MTLNNLRGICVIPARGGSKRLPRKNVVDFLGRPIITYTIEAGLGCPEIFDKVVVSTEDTEIGAVAEAAGAEVIHRQPELATDEARVVDVCIDVLDRERKAGRTYDVLCCLYATAPLRTADDVRATMALIDPPRCNFAMAVTRFDHYPHHASRISEDGSLEPLWPDLIGQRVDGAGELVTDNGSTYAAATREFRSHRTFHAPGVRGHVMPRRRSVDIDLPEDLELAVILAEGEKKVPGSV